MASEDGVDAGPAPEAVPEVPPETPRALEGSRRLHPTTLLFAFGRALRRLLVPAAIALAAGRGSIWEVVFFVMFGLSAAQAVIRYLTFTWELCPDEVVTREGLLLRSERHVPYGRLQNVEVVQNPFHRLFGVAEARLETAGGSQPEAVLRVVALADVARLRDRLGGEEAAGGAALMEEGDADGDARPAEKEPTGRLLLAVPARHLVLLGLVMNRGFAVVGVAIGALYEVGAFEEVFALLGLERRIEALVASGLLGALVGLLAFLAAAALVLVLLSVAWTLVRFDGFTIRKHGDDLRLSCGLLTRLAASIPRHRIQSLVIHASWLHRLFGFASIEARTADAANEEEAAAVLRRRFVPILPARDVDGIVREVLPALADAPRAWRALPENAVLRVRRRTLVVVLLLAAPVVVLAPAALLAAAPAALLAWILAGAAVRRVRVARVDGGLLWERGLFTRRTTLLPDEKIQTVRTASSPFDRRHGHATLVVDAAGGGAGEAAVRIRYLEAAHAEDLRADLANAAARTVYVTARRRTA